MKKKQWKIIVIGFFLALLAILIWKIGFSNYTDEKKWTVLLFIEANNSLEDFSELDLDEIKSIGKIKNFNLLVEVNRKGKSSGCEEFWDGSYRFELHKNGNQLCPSKGIKIKSNALLDRFKNFIEYGKKEYPPEDNKYLITFWNHGNKWIIPRNYGKNKGESLKLAYQNYVKLNDSIGLCNKPRSGSESIINNFNLLSFDDFVEELEKGSFLNSIHSSISIEEGLLTKNNNIINGDEIAEAMDNIKTEIMAFDSCLLGTMEMAYSLKNKTNIMVASEEVVPVCGYNYEEVLKLIQCNPNIESKELAKGLVKMYHKEYSSLYQYSLSAVILSQIENLNNQLDMVSSLLITELEKQNNELILSKIEETRKKCISYGWSEFEVGSIDLNCFLQNLQQQIEGDNNLIDLKINLTNCLRIINESLILYEKSSDQGQKSKGLAIYFPKFKRGSVSGGFSRVYIEENKTLYPVLEFVKNSKWDNFLRTYKSKIENYKS